MLKKIPEVLHDDLNSKLEKLQTALAAKKLSLPDEVSFDEALRQSFSCSEYITNSCVRDPAMLLEMVADGDLYRSYQEDEYGQKLKELLADATTDDKLGNILRKYRNREMVRIAWRELSGWSRFEEIYRELSELAETCIDETFSLLFDWHCQRFGIPQNNAGQEQKIVVLGMGKLGAGELNYSSDIDLIFTYPEMGSTVGGKQSVTNEEFFVSLCQKFLKIFGSKGIEGIIFRVDMRLRPFGESGPLAMSFNATEEYYQRHGSEWERYAFIKAKTVAGDKYAGAKFLERLQPFIYRRYLDYGVYESLREMKKKISREVEKKGYQDNIKLGAGGIREIEFFGQIFQLARGGVEAELRARPILTILTTLAEKDYISQQTWEQLTEAYYFLRRTENRLQEFRDQQIHHLPVDKQQQVSLATSMGFDSWNKFKEQLTYHTDHVHAHFNELLVNQAEEDSEEGAENELLAVWMGQADDETADKLLRNAGYQAPEEMVRLISALREDNATLSLSPLGRGRLDKLMPQVLLKVGGSNEPELVFKRVSDLIKTIEQRTNYIALMLENPNVLTHLIKLSQASPWITSFLARHPLLLDELIDHRTLGVPPDKEKSKEQLDQKLRQVADGDPELQLDELIIFKNINTLHVAAADISGLYPLMKVSDYLSETAETVLEEVFELSWNYCIDRYGKPVSNLEGKDCEMGFAVVAYGKLGGIELGYASDLDLVFLHVGANEPTSGGDSAIDSPQFYTRLGQRIVHLLTAHTRAGRLYEIDMRLRPSGNSGILVSNAEAFRDYQLTEAWTWEHQAVLKARVICGDPAVGDFFNRTRNEIITKPRIKSELKEEIRSMRDRMLKEHVKPGDDGFNLKRGKGGIVDIEFLVQYLVLLNASQHESLAMWTDNVRLLETLDNLGILDKHATGFLKETYLIYRAEVHRLSLQEKPAVVSGEDFIYLQNRIQEIWDSHFK